jgi:hypothetical protein
MKEKQLEALIRKVQKEQELLAKKKEKLAPNPTTNEDHSADTMFSEMKKLPFSS